MNARRTVVVGVDGSAEALRAVRWAVPEARRRQAVLHLVTAFAWTEDPLVGITGLGPAPYGQHLRAAAEKGLAAAETAAAEARSRPARRARDRARLPGRRAARAVADR